MVVKPLDYPPKILVAWGEAITGNTRFRDWLIMNGYRELGLFVFAMHNKDDARMWLMKNGYPHLMAMLNGIERNKNALIWLKKHGYDILFHMALAGDGDEAAYQWLLANNHAAYAMIAKKIEYIKDQIEDDNNDPHHISFD
jgi:hypothetical protein